MAEGTDAPEWHAEGYPEWRPAPPWVMEEMIASAPSLVAPVLAATDAAPIAQAVLEAARGGDPVVVTGCGTSEHGAQAVAELLDAALRRRGLRGGLVEPRQALEQALDPRAGGVCLAVSHDGGTRATLLALEAAGGAGAVTAAITARAGAPIGALARHRFVTPSADRSWCHTVAYVSAILAGAAIAAALAETEIAAEPVIAFLDAALKTPGAHAIAAGLEGRRTLLVAGAGADGVTATELTLKIEEGARRPVAARHLETLLHGHLAACDGATGLILVATDPRGGERRDRRLALAAEAAATLGVAVAAIVSETVDRRLPAELTPAGRIVLPAAGDPLVPLVPLLGGAVALQLLTLAMVDQAGVNPDLIRREERPYREAARIAEEGGAW